MSYEQRHNEANGENNQDGHQDNLSWNCGAEGPTDDAAINALRRRQKLNFLTTLFLSQGVPMLLNGDEAGHSQQGNNNTYCQDNELSWINWEKADRELMELTSRLIHFRKEHPVFSRKHWFMGKPIHTRGFTDNAHFEPIDFQLPEEKFGKCWKIIWDTANPERCTAAQSAQKDCQSARSKLTASERSIIVLVSPRS